MDDNDRDSGDRAEEFSMNLVEPAREAAAARTDGAVSIDRVEVLMVNLPPRMRRSDAIQSFTVQETPMVRITDSDGAAGTGYVFTIGTGGRAVVEMIVSYLAPLLIGRDPSRIEDIWRALHMHVHASTTGPISSLAIAALDIALWDLRARRAGRPIHTELGGAQRSLALYATEGGWLHIDVSELVENATRAREAGFGGFKVKVGRSPQIDAARIGAVREAVGPDFEIMIDGNQGATLDAAVRRARLLEPFDIAWYEEPLPAETVAAHVRLAQATTIPLAIGESLYGLEHFAEYAAREAVHVMQPCVARVGGITPWLKVVHLAEAYNLPVAPHFLMEAHVGLGCGVPNVTWIEYIPQLDAITLENMRVEGGRAVPSNEPGLGIAWDWEAIDRMRVDGLSVTID
jgi:L-alanine-DL-glutamate epimerase-like enolase superfamily enzyme